MLLISGSLRAGSTNTAVLRTAEYLAPRGVIATPYRDLEKLPHFNPDRDRPPLDQAVVALRHQIHESHAILFSTPEYAGALPGSFKNLLDWTIGDDQPGSIYEKPVAWINASPRPARQAHDSLRLVLEYAKAIVVEAALAQVPVTAADIGSDGLVDNPGFRAQIETTLARVAAHVRSVGPSAPP